MFYYRFNAHKRLCSQDRAAFLRLFGFAFDFKHSMLFTIKGVFSRHPTHRIFSKYAPSATLISSIFRKPATAECFPVPL